MAHDRHKTEGVGWSQEEGTGKRRVQETTT